MVGNFIPVFVFGFFATAGEEDDLVDVILFEVDELFLVVAKLLIGDDFDIIVGVVRL